MVVRRTVERKLRIKIDGNVKLDEIVERAHERDFIIHPEVNEIFLFGSEIHSFGLGPSDAGEEPGVEYTMSNKFVRNINLARHFHSNLPVLIHMKTIGGLWNDGMAIYDAIKTSPMPVTILNYTQASSMSSLILLAANKRVMMPHSYFMFHDGSWSLDGTKKQVLSAVEFDKKTDCMDNIYTEALKEGGKYKNLDENKIRKMLRNQMDKKEEVYLTAKEAVEWGFADGVFDGNWNNLLKYTSTQRKRK